MMNLIVAVDEHWGIGLNGDLLTYIPEDLAYVKKKTLGKIIVMGRATFESLPNKAPLPGRENIILTRDENYEGKGATVCHSMEALWDILKTKHSEDIFVFGGAQIYEAFLPFCQTAYVTKIFKSFQADTFIRNLDQDTTWKISHKSERQHYKSLSYEWVTYERK